MISPNPQTDNYVVIDEKAFKPGYLFAAINKGGATLSMKHGKGINIIRNGDWVVLQILEAGCGKAVQHQGATFSNAKQRQKNTNTVKVSGERNKKLAWGK